MNEELMDDIINYHYAGNEHLFVQDLIKSDKKYAEGVYFELQMQMYLNENKEEDSLFDEE